jgi:hypothetical protein
MISHNVMYMCVRVIDFATFYELFLVGFWNCSDNVKCFYFTLLL